jgi:peptide/histidine transporter 3/4
MPEMDGVPSCTCLEHVVHSKSKSTARKTLPTCCKLSYRIRRLKNKGAILILVWSLLIFGTFNFSQNLGVLFRIQLVAGGLTLPIAGWLADIYFGRYKVIHWSMWAMLVSFVLATANLVVERLVHSYSVLISRYVYGTLMVIAAVGFGGFLANIAQFGVDQLHDASTDEITSFISWYIWCAYSSQFITECIQRALDCIQNEPQLFGNLVFCVQISAALSLDLLFNHWLIQEPVTPNPFKLVYKVLKYASTYKQPRYRSAFTYCEDELPSRIDFGKSKYGGPFTTEQVEDVKTFLRMLTLCLAGNISVGMTVAVLMLSHQISAQLKVRSGTLTVLELFKDSWVVLIPLYEFIFYPMFNHYLTAVRSQTKFALGVLLHIATTIALLVIIVVARHNYLEYSISNPNTTTTIQCVFYHEGSDAWSASLDYRWMAVPDFLYSLSITLFGIGAIEFLVAQSPYSMRGLMVGSGYGILSLSAALIAAASIPFTRRLSVWGTGVISCGFWFGLLLLIVEVLVGIVFLVAARYYKKRKREDVLPNEHIFAERYYANDY